jgi:hypothetical protein
MIVIGMEELSEFVHFTSSPSIDTTHITETLIDLTNETRSRLHEIGDKLADGKR